MSFSFRESAAALLEAADREFRRARQNRRGGFRCGKGCTACCASPFHISEWEAAEVSAGASDLPEPVARRARQRAQAYLEARTKLFARTGFLDSRGALASEDQRLPCPALEEGICLVYDRRPLLCRLFGAPVEHRAAPGRIFACGLNYQPGRPLEDPGFRAAQSKLAAERAAVEAAFDSLGGRRYSEPITVAHALLEDFRLLQPPRG